MTWLVAGRGAVEGGLRISAGPGAKGHRRYAWSHLIPLTCNEIQHLFAALADGLTVPPTWRRSTRPTRDD